MPREAMVWNKPTVLVATTQAGLTAGTAVECQINSAMLTPTPQYNTIPATGCSGPTQSPGLTQWAAVLAWLQDWTKDRATSLSWFAFDNDAGEGWIRIVPNKDDVDNCVAEMHVFVSAGGFGGTFGDGSAGATTATWPGIDKPTITPPTVTLAAAADEQLVDA